MLFCAEFMSPDIVPEALRSVDKRALAGRARKLEIQGEYRIMRKRVIHYPTSTSGRSTESQRRMIPYAPPWARSWLGLGVIALVASCALNTESKSGAVAELSQVDNPALEPRCGVDLALVLDASSSVRNAETPADDNGAVDLVAGAARAFLGGFADTNSRIAVISYNAETRLQLNLTDVSSSTISSGGAHDISIGNPGGVEGPVPRTTGYSEHARTGSGTNWEAGLRDAFAALDDARPDVPRLVVHVTDGRPTRHINRAGETTREGGMSVHVSEAAEAADLIKDEGIHIYTVGIGRARRFLTQMQQVSGPDVFDQDDAGDVFDAANDDVILASDFESLEESLSEIVSGLCASSITITKLASSVDAPDAYEPTSGVDFSATPAAASGFDWVLPNTAPAASKTATTNDDGRAQFQWAIGDGAAWGSGTVAITEAALDGFELLPTADCTRTSGGEVDEFQATIDVADGTLSLDLAVGDTIACEIRNRALPPGAPPRGTITVTNDAGISSTPEPGAEVVFTFTIRETSGTSPVTIDSIENSVFGDLDGQGDCALPISLAAGDGAHGGDDTYTCSISVLVSGNGGTTESNVFSASGTDENDQPVTASDDSVVEIEDELPIFHICKLIEPDVVPPEGVEARFKVFIFHDGSDGDPYDIVSVYDDVYGEITDRNNPNVHSHYCISTLQPRGSTMCAYTAFIPGGTPGDEYMSSVYVQVADDEGNTADATDAVPIRIAEDTP